MSLILLYGYKFNEATAISANESLFEALAPIEETIKAHLLESKVVHFDETGLRVAGKPEWMHTACSEAFCFLFVHAKRGKKALGDQMSVLKEYKNWAVHDCYATYFTFKDCKHALCNAHILRELQALKEQNSVPAVAMHDFLMTLYHKTEKGTKSIHETENQAIWRAKYEQICQQAQKEEPFAFVQAVPFTNNLAEQAIRNVKIKQKIATFRTQRGGTNLCQNTRLCKYSEKTRKKCVPRATQSKYKSSYLLENYLNSYGFS